MKLVDILAAVLLVVGGLNWGLVGILEFDLVASILGAGSVPARMVYALVGISAVYQALGLRSIQHRWMVGAMKPA